RRTPAPAHREASRRGERAGGSPADLARLRRDRSSPLEPHRERGTSHASGHDDLDQRGHRGRRGDRGGGGRRRGCAERRPRSGLRTVLSRFVRWRAPRYRLRTCGRARPRRGARRTYLGPQSPGGRRDLPIHATDRAAREATDRRDRAMSPQTGARILLIDDEPAIVRAVRANLGSRGFRVDVAESGSEALERVEAHPDLILLDLGLPDLDGLDLIRTLRSRGRAPIIVLSARGAERDKVRALDLGADDYLTKPFGVEELLARIRVALRHTLRSGTDEPVFRTRGLIVDVEHRRVTVNGEELHLTPTEYALLTALVRHADHVVTDAMLLQEVWGPEYGDEDHYLHVYVARLRKKLERDPQKPRYIATEPGIGYRLLTEEA